MMKLILGALTAAVIAGVAFVQPAEARCFWNGFAMECYRSHFVDPYRFDRFDRPSFYHREHVYRDWDMY